MADQTTNIIDNISDTIVDEWVVGLPDGDALPGLTQPLAPPGFATAFSVPPEPLQNSSHVTRAANSTINSLCSHGGADEDEEEEDQDSGKLMKIDCVDDDVVGGVVPDEEHGDSTTEEQQEHGKNKRQRLVWTPQLHKRFVDVVGHLGIKNAVPKTIMQMMNVEGLTRENVASHLQKYRLYLKRMHDGGTSSTTSPNTQNPEPHGMGELPYAPMPVYGVGGYHMMMQQQQQQQQQQQHQRLGGSN